MGINNSVDFISAAAGLIDPHTKSSDRFGMGSDQLIKLKDQRSINVASLGYFVNIPILSRYQRLI